MVQVGSWGTLKRVLKRAKEKELERERAFMGRKRSRSHPRRSLFF